CVNHGCRSNVPMGELDIPMQLELDTAKYTRPAPPAPEPKEDAEALLKELCGDEVNGGFIRNLCFTVWQICQNPTHEDGKSDWGNDTLPTVQNGVAYIRETIRQHI